MSGLEVIGIATSAIRVAQILMDVINIFNQIRNTPKVAQDRLRQLHTLADIARLIETTSALQTAEIDVTLRDCSRATD